MARKRREGTSGLPHVDAGGTGHCVPKQPRVSRPGRCAAGKAAETAKDRLLRDGVYGEADLSQLVYSSFMIHTDNVKVLFVHHVCAIRTANAPTDEMLAFVDAKTGEVVWYRE